MRLDALDHGHKLPEKAFLGVIRLTSRQSAPDVVKLLLYRRDFFGDPINEAFEAAMRGPSDWSVGDRELMASFVSKANECEF